MNIYGQGTLFINIEGKDVPVKCTVSTAGSLDKHQMPFKNDNKMQYEGHIICEFVDENTDD